RRRHTISKRDWSSDVCSSDLPGGVSSAAMAGDAPLADLRVVERASGLAASYAGFLPAALGAEVVKVEPPGAARTAPGASVVEREIGRASCRESEASTASHRSV